MARAPTSWPGRAAAWWQDQQNPTTLASITGAMIIPAPISLMNVIPDAENAPTTITSTAYVSCRSRLTRLADWGGRVDQYVDTEGTARRGKLASALVTAFR